MSGTAGTAYRAEISALQNYQKEILNTLDAMVIGNAALTTVNAVNGAFSGGQNNNGLGTFPEAVSLSNTYNSVMQTMINNFKEISDLVTAMANVLGKSAQSYADTEQQLTDQFNQIVAKYESQAGGFSTPGSPTATGAPGTQPMGGTTNAYYSATPNTGGTGSPAGSTGSSTTGSSSSTPGGGGATTYTTPTSNSNSSSSGDSNDQA